MGNTDIPLTAEVNYLNIDPSVKSWLLTTDHKRIGILYMLSVTVFFVIAGIFALLMRINLLSPDGAIVSPETYNRLFTMHGLMMIFFFLIPSIPAVLGNFVIPLMIGARDVAFPRLNLLSWYLFMTGGLLATLSAAVGGVDTGWTFYTPFSSTFSTSHVYMMASGVFIVGFSSILTALNFIVTIHTMRAPGLTWSRLPLFLWSMYSTAVIIILGTPILAISLLLMMLERLFHVGIFDPNLGGDPVLFQHLFWFYSHPAVYVMILPAMGWVSEAVTCFSRKRIFGYGFVAFASIAIAVLSFLVWAHHMFVAGMSIYAGMIFSLLSYMVAVPSAIKVFNWTATIFRGSVSYDTPMLYVLGFIGLFTLGGLTGLFLANLAIDVHVTDTYFVVAHFHYIMVGGMVMGYLGGLHYWWPKMTGKLYPDMWGRLSAAIIFLGFNLTFFPQYILGYMGMNRRYATYAPEFQFLNVLSTAGATILGVGYILPIIYLIWSLRYGRDAGPNPWKATGLEWQTSSPPPKHNFHEIPVVTQPAYNYSEMELQADAKE